MPFTTANNTKTSNQRCSANRAATRPWEGWIVSLGFLRTNAVCGGGNFFYRLQLPMVASCSANQMPLWTLYRLFPMSADTSWKFDGRGIGWLDCSCYNQMAHPFHCFVMRTAANAHRWCESLRFAHELLAMLAERVLVRIPKYVASNKKTMWYECNTQQNARNVIKRNASAHTERHRKKGENWIICTQLAFIETMLLALYKWMLRVLCLAIVVCSLLLVFHAKWTGFAGAQWIQWNCIAD